MKMITELDTGIWKSRLLCLLIVSFFWKSICGVELTFELPDNAKECFYEEVSKGESATLEYQVVTGGNYDVDVTLEGPNKEVLYKQNRNQYDSHTFITETAGTYAICFSNEFSTFSHKLVYMDFHVGEEKKLPGIGDHLTAMTQMESSSLLVHENLNSILDYQTHHKLREAQGRKRAEDLNERVLYWSLGEAIAILMIGIGQVWILKNFFSEKRPYSGS